VNLSGGGDCVRTSEWGSKWDWNRDWSINWGKDFDLEWEENKADVQHLKEEVQAEEQGLREAAAAAFQNCSAALSAAAAASSSQHSTHSNDAEIQSSNTDDLVILEISDGSASTINDTAAAILANCTAALMRNSSSNSSSSNSSSFDMQQQGQEPGALPLHHHRKLSADLSLSNADIMGSRSAAHSTEMLRVPVVDPGAMDETARGQRRLAQYMGGVNTAGMSFKGWDAGCWYCFDTSSYAYSSGWFYRYW
jgi:hypothetical protein